jgi:hypothetical protein
MFGSFFFVLRRTNSVPHKAPAHARRASDVRLSGEALARRCMQPDSSPSSWNSKLSVANAAAHVINNQEMVELKGPNTPYRHDARPWNVLQQRCGKGTAP